MGQSKEIKENWRGPKNLSTDIYFCVIFGYYDLSFYFLKGDWALGSFPAQFLDFSNIY